MLQYLFILLLFKIFVTSTGSTNTANLLTDCKYVSISLTGQSQVKNQNYNTRYVMDDYYNRMAKKYHMSSNMMKSCLESKYGKNKK